MRLEKAIVHEQNPGASPDYLLEQLATIQLPTSKIGIEMDVTLKKAQATGEYVPVALSRDRSGRVDLSTHIKLFSDKGFKGPYFIDLIDRRASAAVLSQVSNHPDKEILVQVPEVAIAYKTPKWHQNNTFEVEQYWQDSWHRLTVSSRHPHLVREFLDYGHKVNLFWEPIECDSYRAELRDIISKIDLIIYKMPHLTYSAKFDTDTCMSKDLDFFNSVANEMLVAPMGTTELFRTYRTSLFGDLPSESTNSNIIPINALQQARMPA